MKSTLLALILMAILFTSCNNKNAMSATNNEKLVKQYFEYFNKHEWAKMANMYADTAEFKDPTLGQGVVKQTRQQTIDKYIELHKIFPDLHDNVIQTYPSGDKYIIVEFVSTGTAADKTKFELPICTILTIEKGVITKDFTYFDNFEEAKK